MELKKNPQADLESKKGFFIQIGLIVALLVTIGAYEYKSYGDNDINSFGAVDMDALDEEDIEITRPDEVKPPPPPEAPPEAPEEIEIKENEEELETELEVDDAEANQEMEMMEEEEFSEPFISVEQMPMLGDCKDETCTQTEIMKFIARNFKYPEIAKANGVEGRVILEFVVEKNGKVGRVKILKGLDKHIDKAAINVVEKLPVFTPGKQIGKAVPVKYTVPIKCSLG
jgi:protein TonB